MKSFFTAVREQQESKNSKIALGIDPDFQRDDFRNDPQAIIDWAADLIDKVEPYICCVKLQGAFYYALKADVIADITEIAHARNLPVILDHKHNDIGPVADAYAHGSFVQRNVDAVTVNAYMGSDTVLPFTEYEGKGVFVLARTSNPSSEDFQSLPIADAPLYVHLSETAKAWGDNVGLVVGATQPEAMARIRAVTDAWVLAPGLGAQGGDAARAMSAAGKNIILSASRGIANADDPVRAARAFRESVEVGFDGGQ